MIMKASIALTLASSSLATPSPHASQLQPRTDGFQWGKCHDPSIVNTTLQCGSLMVPKDYSDPNSEDKIRVDVIKAAATKEPSKGSLFMNWGGPGGSGIHDMRLISEDILAATGQQHDIINVIPRGTNGTYPFSCFDDDASREIGTESIVANSSNVALGRLWAKSTIFAENCATVNNDTGRFIGTAFSARDIMRVVDAIEPDGLLRFWGISYGTVLGATLAALFPDKIERMILDGLMNPIEYYKNREVELYDSVDDLFRIFIEGCAENPHICPFAEDKTADEVEELLVETFEALKANPLPMPIPGTPGGGRLMDYSAIKGYVYNQLYWPTGWVGLASTLDAVIRKDIPDLIDAVATPYGAAASDVESSNQHREALTGIKCSDVLDSEKGNWDSLADFFERRRRSSRFFGGVYPPTTCPQWKLPAKERYDGDFKVKTKKGVMLINNSYDPITPLASAKNVSALLEGSSLLLQDGAYGHTTMAQFSTCTAKAIQAYLNDGVLPKPDAKCTVNIPVFSNRTGWEKVAQGGQ